MQSPDQQIVGEQTPPPPPEVVSTEALVDFAEKRARSDPNHAEDFHQRIEISQRHHQQHLEIASFVPDIESLPTDQQDMIGETIEIGQEAIVDHELLRISERPIAELPAVKPNTESESEEFWVRRGLRPETEGGKYHNIPVLGLGVRYEGDKAILSVPTSRYLNGVVDKYNPGGFRFVDVEDGVIDGLGYLESIQKGEFPLSTSHEIDVGGTPDTYQVVKYGKDEAFDDVATDPKGYNPMLSGHEHDIVDHIGIAALPTSEAQKIAKVAGLKLEDYHSRINPANQPKIPEIPGLADKYFSPEAQRPFLDTSVGFIDQTLDDLSYYATMPAVSKNEEEAEIKDEIWQRIVNSWTIGGTRKEELMLDRAAFDNRIKEMQAIRTDQQDILGETVEISQEAIVADGEHPVFESSVVGEEITPRTYY